MTPILYCDVLLVALDTVNLSAAATVLIRGGGGRVAGNTV